MHQGHNHEQRKTAQGAARKSFQERTSTMKAFLVALVIAIAFIAGAVATWVLPLTWNPRGQYRAEAWLKVNEEKLQFPYNFVKDDFSDEEAIERQMLHHKVMIRSPFVLNVALRKLKGVDALDLQQGEEPLGWLARRIELNHGDGYLTIGMAGNDPEQLKRLVNAVTEAYLEQVVHQDRSRLIEERNAMERTFREKSEDLRQRRERILAVSSSEPILQEQARRELALDYSRQVREHIADLRRREDQAARELRKLGQSENGDADSDQKDSLSSEISRLENDREATEAKFLTISATLPPDPLLQIDHELWTERIAIKSLEELLKSLGADLEYLSIQLNSDNRVELLQKAEVKRNE